MELSDCESPVRSNLGNPDERTSVRIAKTIVEMTGSRSKIVFRPLPTDARNSTAPYRTGRNQLGLATIHAIEQGLHLTIAISRPC